jgi:two-component system cell cycle sensor histidine kinase/response regulator CckA
MTLMIVGLGLGLGVGYWAGRLLPRQRQGMPRGERNAQPISINTPEVKAILAASPLAIVFFDAQGDIAAWNASAEKLFGWSEAEVLGGKPPYISAEEMPGFLALQEQVRQGQTLKGIKQERRRKDNKQITVTTYVAPVIDAHGHPLAAIAMIQDMSEEIRLQAELDRGNKIETIGILAGAIAHDFNNLLAAIAGNLELALLDAPEGLKTILKDASDASFRARGLTQQLLTFSRGGAPVKRVIDLASLLTESMRLTMSGKRHVCVMSLEPGLWQVEADEGQVAQVVSNLLINADQAMEQAGELGLKAANVQLPGPQFTNLPAGPYVRVSVSDQGQGIPTERLKSVFEPFFTTKKKGTGLGLAIADNIMRKHGGCIQVESQVGKGSVFTLYFPALTQTREPKAAAPVLAPSARLRILVLDDEHAVHAVAQRMLEAQGHEVRVFEDPYLAIEAFKEARVCGAGFDLAILDLTLPGTLGGSQVVRALRREQPDFKAIASSGYATDPVMGRHQDFGFAAALPKPYRMEELRQAVVKAMGGW